MKPRRKPLGRPRVIKVTRRMIEILRNDPARYSWPVIAGKLGISRSSVLAIWNAGGKAVAGPTVAGQTVKKPLASTGTAGVDYL